MGWLGGTYVGQYKYREDLAQFIPHGIGRLSGHRGSDGTVEYDGKWAYGRRQGEGTATLPSGFLWKGQWQEDVAEGKGVVLSPNGFVLAADIGLADSLTWSPRTLQEAVATLASLPTQTESLAIVRRMETELAQRGVAAQNWRGLAVFLGRLSGCAGTNQLAGWEKVRRRVLSESAAAFRAYLSPPDFRLREARLLTNELGDLARPWLELIEIVCKDPRDPHILERIPAAEHPVASTERATSWVEYGQCLQWLESALSDSAGTKDWPSTSVSEESFRRRWDGWLNTVGRLSVEFRILEPAHPTPPTLCWSSPPTTGEKVSIGGKEIDAGQPRIQLAARWGETVECSVSRGTVQWTYDIRLYPSVVGKDAKPAEVAAALLSLRGLDRQSARARIGDWSRAKLLSCDLEQGALDATAMRTAFRVVPSKPPASLPSLEIVLASGEGVAVKGAWVKAEGATPALVPMDAKWGEAVTVGMTNALGIREDRTVTLMPEGEPVERMARLMELRTLEAREAVERVKQWAGRLTPEALEEAQASCVVRGQVVLQTPQRPLGWPRIRFEDTRGGRLSWRKGDGFETSSEVGMIELNGRLWGERLEYRLANQFGVMQKGSLFLLPENGDALYRVQDDDWPKLSRRLTSTKPYLTADAWTQMVQSVKAQIVTALPEAIKNPRHPLRQVEDTPDVPSLHTEAVRGVLAAVAQLQALTLDIVKSTDRGIFEYKGRKVHDKAMRVTYGDRQKGVDDFMASNAVVAARAGALVDPSVVPMVRPLIARIVESRASAIHGVFMQSDQPHPELPMLSDFLRAIGEMEKHGALVIPSDTPLGAMIRDMRTREERKSSD